MRCKTNYNNISTILFFIHLSNQQVSVPHSVERDKILSDFHLESSKLTTERLGYQFRKKMMEIHEAEAQESSSIKKRKREINNKQDNISSPTQDYFVQEKCTEHQGIRLENTSKSEKTSVKGCVGQARGYRRIGSLDWVIITFEIWIL